MATLKERASEIKNENNVFANTRERVGGLLEDMATIIETNHNVLVNMNQIPNGSLISSYNGRLCDSGWRWFGHPANGKLKLDTLDVISYNGILTYGNSFGAMRLYKQANDNILHLSPDGGVLHIGKRDNDLMLSNIEMGFRVAGDVIKTYRNSTANGTYYKIACDPTYGKNKQVHLGWHAYDTNVGYKSNAVNIGVEAGELIIGKSAQTISIGKTTNGTDLSVINMGLINANDVVDAYRHIGSGNYFYFYGSDHNYRKIFKTRFGAYSNDAEFGSNTNYAYLGFKSGNVIIGKEATNITIGEGANVARIGYNSFLNRFGFATDTITIGGKHNNFGVSQKVTIYRGGSSSENPVDTHRVFEATSIDTRVAGAGIGDMTNSKNVLILRDSLNLRAGGHDIINVSLSENKPIYVGNNTQNDIEIRGTQLVRASVDTNRLILSKAGTLNFAQLYSSGEIYIGKHFDSDLRPSKIAVGLHRIGDVVDVFETGYGSYYQIACDPQKNSSSRFQKVRVGNYANDVEFGSYARTIEFGHGADNVYIKGANTYMDKLAQLTSVTDAFEFVMLDGNKKLHRITKQAVKNWLGIA